MQSTEEKIDEMELYGNMLMDVNIDGYFRVLILYEKPFYFHPNGFPTTNINELRKMYGIQQHRGHSQ